MNTPIITVYGIANCDSVKKARSWLTEHGLAHAFHDFKKQGVPTAQLPGWLSAAGWELLLNRKGTTWRKLDEAARLAVVDAPSATTLMLAQPSVIKRPVVVWPNGQVSVGFDAAVFAARAVP
ncbi:ArsC family reductase [Rhodoferax sp.]|uniref:ArsC family reductase n=1 Tax=Rhodoferax sp. TaxID=50421 RepID=UPI0025E2C59C|nr:ArsC family reductase [Rhodoferax sp.]